MNGSGTRVILRTASSSRLEIRELVAGILAAELLFPSRCIWLVSPWIRDIELLDNRTAAFRGLGPTWAQREIRLFDILAELVRRGATLVIATLPGDDNARVLETLQREIKATGDEKRLNVVFRPQLHAKGLVGDDFCLSGSMNFTRNGIENLDEMVTFTRVASDVGALRMEFEKEYGGSRE